MADIVLLWPIWFVADMVAPHLPASLAASGGIKLYAGMTMRVYCGVQLRSTDVSSVTDRVGHALPRNAGLRSRRLGSAELSRHT